MPKTLKQDIIFTIIMVIFMVYAMVCYNMSLALGKLSNDVLLNAFSELPLMCLIAFLIEFLFVGKITKKIAFKKLDVKTTNPLFITIFISCLTVAFMCPLMSLVASLLFNFNGLDNIFVNFVSTCVKNFPMALLYQLFVAGPLVRFIFNKIFNRL